MATKNTRLVSEFDSQDIRAMKARLPADACIVGSTLGGESRVIPVFPRDKSIALELLEEQRFSGGWV